MRRKSLSFKIFSGYMIVLSVVILFLIISSMFLSGLNNQVKGLIGIENLVEGDRDLYQSNTSILKLINSGFTLDNEKFTKISGDIGSNFKQVNDRYLIFKNMHNNAGRELVSGFTHFEENYKRLERVTGEIELLIKEKRYSEANLAYTDSYSKLFDDTRDAIDQLTSITYEEAIKKNKKSTFIINNSGLVIVSMILLLSMIIILISYFITKSISGNIFKAIDKLSNSSSQIASSSNQLSGSSQQIAIGAAEQASTIEETSASIEELTSMVRKNTSNAKEASMLSEKVSTESMNGFKYMEMMLESMEDMNKSSSEIGRIIKIIDDIAFQTNLLALNAAVEAARAGEAGLGFAVVADEVKKLASKTGEAAKETANLIQASINRTETGVETAKFLSDIFKGIISNTSQVNGVSKEVETASINQDAGITQVNNAIGQLDEVVQQNAASAEQTASSAEELNSQVETLNSILNELLKVISGEEKGKKIKIEKNMIKESFQREIDPTKLIDLKKMN